MTKADARRYTAGTWKGRAFVHDEQTGLVAPVSDAAHWADKLEAGGFPRGVLAWTQDPREHVAEAVATTLADGGVVAHDASASALAEPKPFIRLDHPADTLKMVRETLCVAQAAMRVAYDAAPVHEDETNQAVVDRGVRQLRHMERIDRMIADIDRQRPLGPDGKHGDRHTATCGCEAFVPLRRGDAE